SVRRYRQRISGPVRDRIDLRISVEPPTVAGLDAGLAESEKSAVMAERVLAARERQRARLRDTPWRVNGEVPGPYLRRELLPPSSALVTLHENLRTGLLTARGADRVLRVAWSIADLAGHDVPTRADVSEAIVHRTGGR